MRHDSDKDWERLDTLSRRTPEMSYINEDAGIVNTVCEDETNENGNGNTVSQSVEIDIENTSVYPVKESNSVDLSRERPKTRKAVLVKTETMDDFENGFELITESDLGCRTESELSSENDSTATHTISLSFSDMFDGRQKENATQIDTSTDNVAVNNDNEHIHTISGNTYSEIENTYIDSNIVVADTNEITESENTVGNNDSLEVIATRTDVDIALMSETQTNTEIQDILKGIIDLISPDETDSIQICDPLLDMYELKEPQRIVVENSCSGNAINKCVDQIYTSKITTNMLNNVPQSESFVLTEIPRNEVIEDTVKGSDSLNSVPQNESFLLLKDSQNELIDSNIKNFDEQLEKETAGHNVSVDVNFEMIDDNDVRETGDSLLKLNPEQNLIVLESTEKCVIGEAGVTHINSEPSEHVNEIRIQFDISATEKEFTELLAKDKILGEKVLKKNSSIHIFKPNEFENIQSIKSADKTMFPEIIDKHDAMKKLSPISLSNEYIVLEAVPPTPTVLVQESIIFESDAKLPIHLDSTYICPVRGRRAYTLNDIVFKPNSKTGRRSSDFNLPAEGMEEKSKSSPEISAVKSNDDKSAIRTYFDFANLNEKQTYISENITTDNQDQSEYTKAENNKASATYTFEEDRNNVSGSVSVLQNNKTPNREVLITEQSEVINRPTGEFALDNNILANPPNGRRDSLDCDEHKDVHVTVSASILYDVNGMHHGKPSGFNEGTVVENATEQCDENSTDPFNLCSTIKVTDGHLNNTTDQSRRLEQTHNTLETVALGKDNTLLNSFQQLPTATSHAVVELTSAIKADSNQVLQSSTRAASTFGDSTRDLNLRPVLLSGEESSADTNSLLQLPTLTSVIGNAVEDSTTDLKEELSLLFQPLAPTIPVVRDSTTDYKEDVSPFHHPSAPISHVVGDFNPFLQPLSTPTSSSADESVTDSKENVNISSTPASSAAEKSTTDSNEEFKPFPNKKTLKPSAFQFSNMNDIDNDFENSDSSETSGESLMKDRSFEIPNIHTSAISTFESEVLGISDQTIEARGAGSVDPLSNSISMTDDSVNITKSTDSSAALSWEILSGVTSNDSRNGEHCDIANQTENEIGRLTVSLSGKSNIEENVIIHSQTDTTALLVLTPEASTPLISNNTSIFGAETTDTSLDIINASEDNSEC